MTAEMERITELEQDNMRLRRLLDQRDAPGELRHRLRSTISLLRSIVRMSAATSRDLPDFAGHLEDRLDAIARVQAFVDRHGRVDLRTLLIEELFQYGASDGDRLRLTGPDIALEPKAGQVIALALHELAVNAVEHGALGALDGRVEISWSLAGSEQSSPLSFSWKEHGPAREIAPVSSGFGTDVLTRMLSYELEAITDLKFEPDGLRCTISLPFPERVGQAA